ncbi:MAG: hypothetical protein UT48_C0042G0004 [Parcubacteria group bacterium GW2011_GWE2_39_37]|nr:MAG: hypothetical protein UT48_C0042G0004 [Parcubacteria group bacterium GW2011_GWE2_39_37]
MRNQLEKAINLCKKTGDRLIVFDNVRSEEPFVVMNLDEYEKLSVGKSEIRGLTENELLDKINRDIAIWKSEQPTGQFEVENTENIEKNAPEEDLNREFPEQEKKRKQWSIRNDIKEGAEEIIEEDRQYLEEVSF